MASALTIGLNTTHHWDLADANEAIGQVVLTMDAFTAANLWAVHIDNAWGWKDRIGKPGDISYVPASMLKFTDGDSTIYELVSAKAADHTFHITREHSLTHHAAGDGLATARDGVEVSQATCAADAGGSLAGKYFHLWDEAGTKYHVWFSHDASGASGTADPAPTGSTGIEIEGAHAGQGASTIAGEIAYYVNAHASFGAAAVGTAVNITDAATGDATDIADGNLVALGTWAFATTTQGTTVEMLIRPTSTGSLGYGTNGGASDHQRKRLLGYI